MENKDTPFKDSLPKVNDVVIESMNSVAEKFEFSRYHIEYLKGIIIDQVHKALEENESILQDALVNCPCNKRE